MLKIKLFNPNKSYIQFGQKSSKPNVLLCSNPIKHATVSDEFVKSSENTTGAGKQLLKIPFKIERKSADEQGETIAKSMKQILDNGGGAVSSAFFKTELRNIDYKNVVSTIKSYDKISPKSSLISDIGKDFWDDRDTRYYALNSIFTKLEKAAVKNGVESKRFSYNFEEELEKQFGSFLPVKTKQLDKIAGALSQAIVNKTSLTKDEKEVIAKADVRKTQEYTSKILESTVKEARASMEKQANRDGWSAKLGEAIKGLWNSENQKEIVHKDIDLFEKQIFELNKSVGTADYNKKFKEIFQVNFDAELIAKFKEKEEQFEIACLCSTVENNFKKSVEDLVNNKPLKDTFLVTTTGAKPIITETRLEMYKRNLKAFSEFVGKGDIKAGKKQINQMMKDSNITEKSSLTERYNVLQTLANNYAKVLSENTQRVLGKKNLLEMKREYTNSYYAAFGVDNDIAKRVEDYRASQKLSELLVQDTIICSASIPIWLFTAGTGIIPTLKIAAMHSAVDVAVYGSDRLSSKAGMTKKELKDSLKWTLIDGTTAIVNQLTYKGISALVSPIAKMSGNVAKITDIALSNIADIGVDCAMEYLGSGKITLQGVVYSVLFTAGGQIIELKALGPAQNN